MASTEPCPAESRSSQLHTNNHPHYKQNLYSFRGLATQRWIVQQDDLRRTTIGVVVTDLRWKVTDRTESNRVTLGVLGSK